MKRNPVPSTSLHHRRYELFGLLGVVILAAACSSTGTGSGSGTASSTSRPSTSGTSSIGANGTSSTTSIPAAAVPALTSALTSAYQAETAALATYRNVVSTLGSANPFPNIVNAEQQHVSTLSGLFGRYQIPLPSSGSGQSSPSTRTAACQMGVTVEQQIVSLYNTELPKVSAYPDVTTAFTNLLSASQDDHLPAFQHCS